MQIIKQKGFDDFNCIAQECPESCCKFWQIFADEDSAKRYRTLGPTDSRVKRIFDEKESCFRQEKGICGFLDPDELCYLQRTYGEKLLCATCRDYPRHVEEFENVREYSLSLSCPHVAEMLLNDPDPMTFVHSENETEEEFEEFDFLLYDKLLYVREYLFDIARDRNLSLLQRLNAVLRLGRELQNLLDEERLFEIDSRIEIWINGSKEFRDPCCDVLLRKESIKRNFSVLFELEILHEDWSEKLDRTWNLFFGSANEKECTGRFPDFIRLYETEGEQLLMLFLYTYFCGSVYDGWIFSKTLLSVCSVLWILMIAFANGAQKSALVKTAYQYAREIEHSDQNINFLEEWFMEYCL